VLIDAVDPLVVFADVVMRCCTDSESHDVFRSQDGGVTWAPLSFGIHATGSSADLAIHFLTADTHAWVMTTEGGLATTSDGGATWSTILGAPASGG
jgi:photosystem II stability/assembly factor-like uncharacterized protein